MIEKTNCIAGTQIGSACRTLALFLSLAAAGQADAMSLVLVENQTFDAQTPKQVIVVKDVLGVDANGRLELKLDLLNDPWHRELVQILSAGMPFDQPSVRADIATILSTFPAACRDRMVVGLMVSPIEDIDTWVPNVKDKRRIGELSVEECLAEQPRECSYSRRGTGAFDFDVGDLKRVLRECSAALHREIGKGAALAPPAVGEGSK